MEFIDPTALKTGDYIQRARNENQKERIAPYRPSIDKGLENLFFKALPEKTETPAPALVDWSFLDQDDGQPGELADWVKKRLRMFEKWQDELHAEMLEYLKNDHKLTRNIPPPSTPQKYDPNEAPFDPSEIFGDMEIDDGEDDDLDDDT